MVQLRDRVEVEIQTLTLPELGERLGIPITVRRWWGSRRVLGRGGLRSRIWECPGYTAVTRPQVRRGVVVLWVGECGARVSGENRRHHHSQTAEVISAGQHALLLEVKVSSALSRPRFLIGTDNGRPFVVPVLRRIETVAEAFDWLVPKPVKDAIASGLDVKRQGDWYFVPHQGRAPRVELWWLAGRWVEMPLPWVRRWEELRQLLASLCGTNSPGPQVLGRYMPATGQITRYPLNNVVFMNAPLIGHYWAVTNHVATEVSPKDPWPLVRGTITARDHPPLALGDWHVAIRNRSTPYRNVAPGARAGD